jgi:outer membrane protein assembly factor BamB
MAGNPAPPLVSARRSATRRLAVDVLLILAVLGMLACTALAFLVPWLPPMPAGGAALARYVPISDGDGWLGEQVTAATSAEVFRGENMRILPHERALTSGLRQAAIDELRKFVLKPGETSLDESQISNRVSAMQIIVEEDQNLAADGKVERTSTALLRTSSGDYQLAVYSPLSNSDLVFDPPLLLHPANFRAGTQWQSSGSLGNFQYQSSGSIAAEKNLESPLGGVFHNCLKVTLRLAIHQQSTLVDDTTYVDRFCSGIGLVNEQELDAGGKLLNHTNAVSSSYMLSRNPRLQISPMPPLALLDPSAPAASAASADPAGWVLDVLGRTGTAADTTESTIQPVWVPANPPFLLVAGHSGDLLALDITQAPGQVLWRYHPNGTIYSQPTFDAAHQQIYFGDSAKQLTALDGRGLYRWSFTCGDNIVTRPVVAGDNLVFGSEDRNVYALDTRSGALRWKFTTGGALVASPAVDGETVMIGSDDGVVYAFNAASGEKLWTFASASAVEAPLVAENGIVYIASRDMNLYAVRTAGGSQVWQSLIGNILRTQPAIGKTVVYLVDENGHLTAVSKSDGRRLWTSVERDYEGAPLLVGQTLLAAGSNGVIYRLSEDGKRQATISGESVTPTQQDFDYRLGLAAGGGAAWAVDTKGYIWRFGPAWTTARPLELAWSASLTSPPFKENPFYAPAQVWAGQFIVVDLTGNVYRVDPATGQAAALGQLKKDPGNFRTGMLVNGDVLLAASADTLYAAHLPDMAPLWQFQAQGFGLAPPVVEGGQLAWVAGGANHQPALNLIDLHTGHLVRSTGLAGNSVPGNAILHDGVVYVNSPLSAYQVDSGQKLWQAAAANNQGIGQSVLSPDGETLYSALTDAQSLQNRVAAVSTRDGSLRWMADLGTETVSLLGKLAVDGGTLVVPLNSATRPILALDAATGKELWRYTPDAPRLGNPSIDNGVIWFILENGQIVAINLKTGNEVGRLGLTQASLESYSFAQAIAFNGEYALAPAGWPLLEIKIPSGWTQ